MNTPNKTQNRAVIEKRLRWLVFAYIILIVIEGALRKWVLPSLNTPLLLVRDPIILLAYLWAFTNGIFPTNKYIITGAIIALVWVISTFLFGHANPFVAAFGVRANFLHIPFAFIIGSVLNRNHVILIGRYWLWATVAMTAIIVLQFSSPQSAWINRGVGGNETAGFGNVMGKSRPPGTFSFTIGLVWFYIMSVAFFVSGITQHKYYSKTLLAVSGIALCIALPVSISRTLILSAAFTFAIGIALSAMQKNSVKKLVRILAIGLVALTIASQFPVFDEAKEVFTKRWEQSTHEKKGGVQTMIAWRILREFLDPFINVDDQTFAGEGIGAGTQVGAKLLTGKQGFQLGEIEWSRLVGEGGLILGSLYIAWRLWIAFNLLRYSQIAFHNNNAFGFIFLSACMYNILVGQWGQTSINGFTVLGIGLTIASMRLPKKSTQATTTLIEKERLLSQRNA